MINGTAFCCPSVIKCQGGTPRPRKEKRMEPENVAYLQEGLFALDTLGRDPQYLNEGPLLARARTALAQYLLEGLGVEPTDLGTPIPGDRIRETLERAWRFLGKESTILWMKEQISPRSPSLDPIQSYLLTQAKDALRSAIDRVYPEEKAYFDG